MRSRPNDWPSDEALNDLARREIQPGQPELDPVGAQYEQARERLVVRVLARPRPLSRLPAMAHADAGTDVRRFPGSRHAA